MLLLAFALCMPQGCKTGTRSAAQERPTDRSIAAEIRAKIAEAGFPSIKVFVLDGRVTLYGTVPSEEGKQRVLAIARESWGIASVSEDLAIEKLPGQGSHGER